MNALGALGIDKKACVSRTHDTLSDHNHSKNKRVDETFTHYLTDKPDELTLSTNDGRKVRVTEDDLPQNNLGQAGEVSKETIKQRLRLMADEKLEEQTGGEEQA
jgi:hypothetical protein